MINQKYSVIFMIIYFLTDLKYSTEIYVPDGEQYQKPITYTSGIKTTSYRRPSQVQLHHNYSKVYHQNNEDYSASKNYNNEEISERPYPIYNAHTYGARPTERERLTQVYVINGTRIRQHDNPVRQIVMYNKQKRTPKIQIYRECPFNATGQLVYEFSCNQFLNCWRGHGYVQNCAPGTLFNPKTLECDFPDKVECITGPRLSILKRESSSKLVKQVGCPRDFSGLIPNYTDCSKFINCVSGIENFMDCPPGTLFDMNKNICDFAEKAHCFNGENENIKERTFDGKLSYHTSTSNCSHGQCSRSGGRQSLGYRHNEIRCPDDVDGLHRHPTDCTKFLNCAHGRTYIQDCAPGTLFNPDIKICDFPYNVRCQQGDSSSNYHGQSSKGSSIYTNPTNQYEGNNRGSYGHASIGSGYDTRQDRMYGSSDRRYNQNRDPYGPSSVYPSSTVYSVDRNDGSRYYGFSKGSSGITYYGTTPHTGIYGNRKGYSSGTSYNNQNNYGVDRNHFQGNQNNLGQDTSGRNPYGHGSTTDYQLVYGNRTASFPENNYHQGNWNQPTKNWDQSIYGDPYGGSSVSSRPYGGSSVDRNPYGGSSINRDPYSGSSVNRDPYSSSSINPNPYSGSSVNRDPYSGSSVNRDPYGGSSVSRDNSYHHSYERQPQNRPYGTNTLERDSNPTYHSSPNPRGEQPYYEQEPLYGRDAVTYPRGESGYVYTKGTPNNQREPLYGRGTILNPTNKVGYIEEPVYGEENTNYGQYPTNNRHHWQNRPTQKGSLWDDEPITTNYDQVVNINHLRPTTVVPFRRTYEPFYGTTQKSGVSPSRSVDYDDTFGQNHPTKPFLSATTQRVVEKNWPPPFPSTDVNADYVFDYDDDEPITLEAENSLKNDHGRCGKSDFQCTIDNCVSKTLVCDGTKDCSNGKDELNCLEYVSKFSVKKNSKLAILEKERWDNVSIANCALLCVKTKNFQCKAFNYRKIDKTCFLTDTNEGLTGAAISYDPYDYYELNTEKVDCSKKFVCSNKKCIERSQLCDGSDDCGDRMDEKGCKPQDFGYSIRLTGSENRNEGQIEVTAFGKTGYVCDDNFGLRDANVVCKELGYHLGALEVKGHSYFAKNNTSRKPFFMMDDVTCFGNESRLMDCDFSGWGVHNCLGQEVAGVICKTPQNKCPDEYWQCDTGQECLPLAFVCDGLLDCTDGSDEHSWYCNAKTEVRLVNGSSRQEGRVEIKHHGIWGTICDDDFNEDAAKVVCKQLGYKGSAQVRKDGYFGAGSGPIWLDQVFCSGNETGVDTCTHWNWGEHNCEHSEDVGVVCSNVYEHERHSVVPMPSVPQVYPSKCGYRKDNIFNRDDDVHFRVVRGSIANQGDYPWQAAIRVKGKTRPVHWCGAVIISEKFVLTAAHCLMGYPKGAYVVVAGDYDVEEEEGTEQEAYIEDYYAHEDFRKGHKMNNDIALVKLKGRGFRLTDDVQAICLPDKSVKYEGDMNCTISGFGSIQSGKSASSRQLRAGWIPIQKREICKMPHVYGDALTEGMICAGSLDEGIDACDGDSGGPLACLKDGVFTLYGITSWGQHCGYANKPGVYVKVAHYRKWIDDTFHKHST